MRAVGRACAAGVAAAALVLLAACVPDPEPTPSSSGLETPISTLSDVDALAAARSAYEAYIEVAIAIGTDGGADSSRIDAVTTGSLTETEHTVAEGLASKSQVISGQIDIVSFELQSRSDSALVAYVCADYTGLNLTDSTGTNPVAPAGADPTPLEVSFAVDGDQVLPDGQSRWSGTSFC